MARTQRLAIRDTSPPPRPVPVDFGSPQRSPSPSLPLCISFIYRGRSVVCAPVWSDAGELVNLAWKCPRCDRAQEFGSETVCVSVLKTGRVTAVDNVRCAAACGFLVAIHDGQATPTRGWWS